MVYTHDLKLCLARDEGSSPSSGTMDKYYKGVPQTPDHESVTRIIDTANQEIRGNLEQISASFDDLFSIISAEDKLFIQKILAIDPTQFGFKGEFFGLQEVPKNLVSVPNSHKEQFLPKQVADSFENMNSAIEKETGRKLTLLSGYRSPAYQTLVFLWNLRANNFDISKTLKSVAMPGYSEHGAPHRQAIDIMLEGDVPDTGKESVFGSTTQYRWLKEHAHDFGFFESYPKDNASGIIHEPWHWHYETRKE